MSAQWDSIETKQPRVTKQNKTLKVYKQKCVWPYNTIPLQMSFWLVCSKQRKQIFAPYYLVLLQQRQVLTRSSKLIVWKKKRDHMGNYLGVIVRDFKLWHQIWFGSSISKWFQVRHCSCSLIPHLGKTLFAFNAMWEFVGTLTFLTFKINTIINFDYNKTSENRWNWWKCCCANL